MIKMIKMKLFLYLIIVINVLALSACKENIKPNIKDNSTEASNQVLIDESENSSNDKSVELTNSSEDTSTELLTEGSDPIESEITDDYLVEQVENNPILMTTPPFSYYKSNNAIEKENRSLKLNMKSCEPNEITDEDKWFSNNNLSINTFQVPNTVQDITGDLPEELDVMWKDLLITKVFYDDSYIYCTYGSDYPEGYILNIYEAGTYKIVFSLDFSEYRYSPEYMAEDYEFIQQRIDWATIKNNILYISHSHSTYAESSNNMNAYITAIDLTDMSILWRTDAMVSNAYNFLIIDDVIISGYGFTKEPDYLYQVDIHTGKVLEKTPLKTAASYIINKGNELFVRTYNMDYEFDIIRE